LVILLPEADEDATLRTTTPPSERWHRQHPWQKQNLHFQMNEQIGTL
jgi:hypothetical protein